jgi:hypothetical protein
VSKKYSTLFFFVTNTQLMMTANRYIILSFPSPLSISYVLKLLHATFELSVCVFFFVVEFPKRGRVLSRRSILDIILSFPSPLSISYVLKLLNATFELSECFFVVEFPKRGRVLSRRSILDIILSFPSPIKIAACNFRT